MPASGESHLFLPKLSATEIRYEGGNWLEETECRAQVHGFTTIQPLQALHEFLARRRGIAGQRHALDAPVRTRRR